LRVKNTLLKNGLFEYSVKNYSNEYSNNGNLFLRIRMHLTQKVILNRIIGFIVSNFIYVIWPIARTKGCKDQEIALG
jgi:hypothetical protein